MLAGSGASLAFVAAGMATAAGGDAPCLAFALASVGGFGMLHGVSDLALVPRSRQAGFLLAYLATVVATLALWRVAPAIALAVFLILSAVHFGGEDAPAHRPAERWSRGMLMVMAPALLHPTAVGSLFVALGVGVADAELTTRALQIGAVAGIALLPLAIRERRRDGAQGGEPVVAALAAALAMPPLIGFATTFVLLHAGPALAARLRQTGESGVVAYVLRHWPVALAAVAVVVVAGLALPTASPPLAWLFGGVSALALPHMLVMPLWRAGPIAKAHTDGASARSAASLLGR